MNYRLAIFDMDGTVLNTLCDLQNSLNAALAQAGLPTHSTDAVRQMVGNGMVKLVERGMAPITDRAVFEQVYASFRAYERVHGCDHTCPYDGIPELLRQLREKGMLTAVLTNKNRDAMERLTKRFFPGLFDFEAGCCEGIRPKPAADGVDACLAALGVRPEDAVLIGDSEVDLQTAQNAHIDAIAVTWGFRKRAVLERVGAPRFADTTDELRSILLEEETT